MSAPYSSLLLLDSSLTVIESVRLEFQIAKENTVDTNRVIVATLTKRRAALVEQIAGIDAALVAFGGTVAKASGVTRTRTRKKPRTQAQIDAITKAQAARKASIAAKAAANTEAPAPKPRTVPGTDHPAARGTANLAEAAS